MRRLQNRVARCVKDRIARRPKPSAATCGTKQSPMQRKPQAFPTDRPAVLAHTFFMYLLSGTIRSHSPYVRAMRYSDGGPSLHAVDRRARKRQRRARKIQQRRARR